MYVSSKAMAKEVDDELSDAWHQLDYFDGMVYYLIGLVYCGKC